MYKYYDIGTDALNTLKKNAKSHLSSDFCI